MSEQMRKMLMIVTIVFGVIFLWYGARKVLFSYFMAHYVPPPVTISATVAKAKDWQSYVTSVGTLMAVNGVDISAEVSGIVKEIRFQSGQLVKKGDLLIQLETSVEEAQLKDSTAQLTLAQLNYNRNKGLVSKNAISRADIDKFSAQLQQAEAGVQQIQARIKQKTILAPFDGKIGIRAINVGQFVSAGTTMVSLQSLDPLYVQFALPEQYISSLYLQQPIELNMNLGNGKTVLGSINAINSKVDQTTRTILIQATLPNKELQLYPGMYAFVKVLLREHKNVVTLPQTAIAYSLHGDSVFLIKSDKKEKDSDGKPILRAYRQYVKIGERRGDEVSILEGVNPDNQVITSGQLKLQNGINVVIDNSVEL